MRERRHHLCNFHLFGTASRPKGGWAAAEGTMGNETLDLGQLASLLRRDQRELSKLADRGQLPGRKVA